MQCKSDDDACCALSARVPEVVLDIYAFASLFYSMTSKSPYIIYICNRQKGALLYADKDTDECRAIYNI